MSTRYPSDKHSQQNAQKTLNNYLKPNPVAHKNNFNHNLDVTSDLDDICTSISQVPVNPLYRENLPNRGKITLPKTNILLDDRFWRGQGVGEMNDKLMQIEDSEFSMITSTSIDTYTPNKTTKDKKTQSIWRWSVDIESDNLLILGQCSEGSPLVKIYCRRISPYIFYDNVGTVCALHGPSDPKRDLPHYIREKFKFGIPFDWYQTFRIWKHYTDSECPPKYKWPSLSERLSTSIQSQIDSENSEYESHVSRKAARQIQRKIQKLKTRLRTMALREYWMSKDPTTNINISNNNVTTLLLSNKSSKVLKFYQKPNNETSSSETELLEDSLVTESNSLHLRVNSDETDNNKQKKSQSKETKKDSGESDIFPRTARLKNAKIAETIRESGESDIFPGTAKLKNAKIAETIRESGESDIFPVTGKLKNAKIAEKQAEKDISGSPSFISVNFSDLSKISSIKENVQQNCVKDKINIENTNKICSKLNDSEIFLKPPDIETFKKRDSTRKKNLISSDSKTRNDLDTNIHLVGNNNYKLPIINSCEENVVTSSETSEIHVKKLRKPKQLQSETSQSDSPIIKSNKNNEVNADEEIFSFRRRTRSASKSKAETSNTESTQNTSNFEDQIISPKTRNVILNINKQTKKIVNKCPAVSLYSESPTITTAHVEEQLFSPKTRSYTSTVENSTLKKLHQHNKKEKTISSKRLQSTKIKDNVEVKLSSPATRSRTPKHDKFTSQNQNVEQLMASIIQTPSPILNKSNLKTQMNRSLTEIMVLVDTVEKYQLRTPTKLNRSKSFEESTSKSPKLNTTFVKSAKNDENNLLPPKARRQKQNKNNSKQEKSQMESSITALIESNADRKLTSKKRSRHLNISAPENDKTKISMTELSKTVSNDPNDVEVFLKSLELGANKKGQKSNSNALQIENNIDMLKMNHLNIDSQRNMKEKSSKKRGRQLDLENNHPNLQTPTTRSRSKNNYRDDTTQSNSPEKIAKIRNSSKNNHKNESTSQSDLESAADLFEFVKPSPQKVPKTRNASKNNRCNSMSPVHQESSSKFLKHPPEKITKTRNTSKNNNESNSTNHTNSKSASVSVEFVKPSPLPRTRSRSKNNQNNDTTSKSVLESTSSSSDFPKSSPVKLSKSYGGRKNVGKHQENDITSRSNPESSTMSHKFVQPSSENFKTRGRRKNIALSVDSSHSSFTDSFSQSNTSTQASVSSRGRRRVQTLPFWEGARLATYHDKTVLANKLEKLVDVDLCVTNNTTISQSDTINNSNTDSILTYDEAFNDFKKPKNPLKMQLTSTFRDSISKSVIKKPKDVNISPIVRISPIKRIVTPNKDTDNKNIKNSDKSESPIRKRTKSTSKKTVTPLNKSQLKKRKEVSQKLFISPEKNEDGNHKITPKNSKSIKEKKKIVKEKIIERKISPKKSYEELLGPKQTTQFKVPKPKKIKKIKLPTNVAELTSFFKKKKHKKEAENVKPQTMPLLKKRKMFISENWLQSEECSKLFEQNETSPKFVLKFNSGTDVEDDKFSEVSALI